MTSASRDGRESAPLLSVVIPTYNAAGTLGEQLAALDRQEVPGEWEIVIALQPCTDETEAVIAACGMDRVRVVEAFERRGASYARNVGAAAARGSLIAFCDADDIVADGWLAELLRHADVPVVAGAALSFTDPAAIATLELSTAELPAKQYGFLQSCYTNSMLVHRSAFAAIGGFDEGLTHCEDTDLAWRLQLAGNEIVIAPEAVVYYRQRPRTRDQWIQYYYWHRAVPALYLRHRSNGMPRTKIRAVVGDWFWLATRLPTLVRTGNRSHWFERSARRAGQLVGSVRHRCLYL